MRVLKFGGSSVADTDAIIRLVSIVDGRKGARTVVVSALAGVTDGLLAVADLAAGDKPCALAALDAIATRHRGVAAGGRAAQTRRGPGAGGGEGAGGAAQGGPAAAPGGPAAAAPAGKRRAGGARRSSRT